MVSDIYFTSMEYIQLFTMSIYLTCVFIQKKTLTQELLLHFQTTHSVNCMVEALIPILLKPCRSLELRKIHCRQNCGMVAESRKKKRCNRNGYQLHINCGKHTFWSRKYIKLKSKVHLNNSNCVCIDSLFSMMMTFLVLVRRAE